MFDERGYHCECPAGTLGDGRTSGMGCHVPMNGCSSLSPCSPLAICTVVDDSYDCQCKSGYVGNGFMNSSGQGCTGKLLVYILLILQFLVL